MQANSIIFPLPFHLCFTSWNRITTFQNTRRMYMKDEQKTKHFRILFVSFSKTSFYIYFRSLFSISVFSLQRFGDSMFFKFLETRVNFFKKNKNKYKKRTSLLAFRRRGTLGNIFQDCFRKRSAEHDQYQFIRFLQI